MLPISRLFDIVLCLRRCPPFGQIVLTLNYTVIVDGLPASVLGSICTNCCGSRRRNCKCPNYVIMGSSHTFIGLLPVTTVTCLVTRGIVLTGSPRVYCSL